MKPLNQRFILQEGRHKRPKNHRFTILLSDIYQIFSKSISKRLAAKLDLYPPTEQTGFRLGHGTNDYLIVNMMEKSVEYKKLLAVIFVDYDKSFDTINQQKMLAALIESLIDHHYRHANISTKVPRLA